MDELDAPAALAGIEQRLVFRPLRSTDPAMVCFIHALGLALCVGLVGRVVHDVRLRVGPQVIEWRVHTVEQLDRTCRASCEGLIWQVNLRRLCSARYPLMCTCRSDLILEYQTPET